MRSTVFASRSSSHEMTMLRRSLRELLDILNPSLQATIKRGDRVLLKPFLRHGRNSHQETRLVSHANLVELLIETLKDYGARVKVGDEGIKSIRDENVRLKWLDDVAQRTGVELVSFAKVGAAELRGTLLFPRSYLISRAFLDVDHVVNCANFQPHGVIGLSGAVKNMFNAVVGHRQHHLHQLFPNPRDLGRVIVDVCELVRPAITFLDLTTVRDPDNCRGAKPVNILLAGTDPTALDAVAAHAVGWAGTRIPTLLAAKSIGAGNSNLENVDLSGLSWTELQTTRLSPIQIAVAIPEGLHEKTTRLLNKTLLRQRPVVNFRACDGCGDCARICPTRAIDLDCSSPPSIRLAACADCHLCVDSCDKGAIQLEFVGVARAVRSLNSALKVRKRMVRRIADCGVENRK